MSKIGEDIRKVITLSKESMTLSKEIRDCPNQGHRLNALYDRHSAQKIIFPAFVQKMSGAAWIQTEVKIGFKTGVSSFYDLDSKGETLLNKSPPEVLSNFSSSMEVFVQSFP